MRKGGYQLVDLKNIKIDDETGANVPGIYDKVEGATKALLFSGVNNDGTTIPDFFGNVSVRETIFYVLISFENYVATYLKIESDDDVSFVTETVEQATT